MINEVLKRLRNVDAKGELDYTNSYTLLIAVVLSAQSTDKAVNKATQNLFKIVLTPKDMIRIGEEELISYIKSLGLYRNKAKNIISLSQILLAKHNGIVPDQLEELTRLPGVGMKTAKVVLATAFLKPYIAVDTHIMRLCQRLKITNSNNPDTISKELDAAVSKEYFPYAHIWLVLHGRYVCKARKPLCPQCKLRDICPSFQL